MPAAFGGVSALAVPAEEIRKNMQRLSKPQTKALAAFSFGIAKAEGCGLNAAAKRLPLVGKSRGGRARIQRFIANGGIDNASVDSRFRGNDGVENADDGVECGDNQESAAR